MASFFDKILIYFFGILTIVLSCDREIVVAYLLTGILVLGVYQLLYDVKNMYVELGLLIVMAVMSILFPLMSIFIPIAVYHHVFHYTRDLKKISVLSLSDIVLFIYTLKGFEIYGKGFMVVSMVFAICMAIKSSFLRENSEAIKKLRDDSMETNLALSDENRYLLKNREEEIRIATLSERNRIARDIHDNVGHLISRSILQLGAIRAVNKDKTTSLLLEQLKDTLDEAMNNIRESVHDLHKESFDLKNGADKILEELNGYDVVFECDISMNADKEVKYTFLTILKEAVTNIIKHSNADRVEVIMRELENYYQMLIEDNGKVEKDIRNVNAGIGVSNMEERVKKMSGIINISTNNGFRIYISIPKDNKSS